MHITVPLGFGVLKIKSYRYLRERERARQVPLIQLGPVYIIYRSNAERRRLGQR